MNRKGVGLVFERPADDVEKERQCVAQRANDELQRTGARSQNRAQAAGSSNGKITNFDVVLSITEAAATACRRHFLILTAFSEQLGPGSGKVFAFLH